MEQRVAILLADGFTDSGLSVALDVLRTANVVAKRAGGTPPFRIDLVSATGGRVQAASGVVLESSRSIVTASRADVLVVPGIWSESAAEVDAMLAREDVRRLVRAIVAAHTRGAVVAGSCSGAFLLAEAGLLDGHEATTAWFLAPHLQHLHPQIEVNAERALVVRGRVICAGTVFAQADLALHLVARFAGPSAARLCARLLLLDTHASQAPYMAVQHVTADDPTVRRAERFIRSHLAAGFDMSDLAKTIGTSPRTLARRVDAATGTSPVGFVQRVRVEVAVKLLQTTRLSLAEIATKVGYSDAGTLRRLIERETKTSPREFRRRLQAGRSPEKSSRAARARSL